jgi:valyl-tRNA synthetase
MSRTALVPKIQEKAWSPALETKVFELWRKENLYRFIYDSEKPVYSIDTPPPYINTPVHIGQAYTYTCMDAIARFKRMQGFNVLFPIGLDRNGLPIEVQAEKEFKISIKTTAREEFISKAKSLLDKYEDITLSTFKKLGLSVNQWEKSPAIGAAYETDDREYRRLTQETFITLFNKGLIYEGEKTANYCPVCHTTISDAEVEYKEYIGDLNHIKFPLSEGGEITVATTRPELLSTCKVIIFNPEDSRYIHLAGKEAIVPIFENRVKIIPHPYAKPSFGSGLVMICSYGDYNDIRILRELGISPTYAINHEGRMTDKAGPYVNMTVREARKKIVEDLRSKGLLVKIDQTVHREPICWRSKNPIEFIPTTEIYLKQVEFKEALLSLTKKMTFYAPESRNLLVDWINSISVDWVISRRRYYGTEIPLWYCTSCGRTIIPPPGRYYQPWKEDPPTKACPHCGGTKFRGEERIFDTWFDSSSSQQYILGYLWDRDFFERNYPCTLRPQGKEIVRSWLYFTVLKSFLQFDKPPFKDVWINHHVVDESGEKMSKSLGNVIDPQEVIRRYGAEAFRIWVFLEGDITEGDIKYSYVRTQGTGKFLTKLWNIARLISSFPTPKSDVTTPSEEWILSELSSLIARVRDHYNAYSFSKAAVDIRYFAWNIFADHYVELVKPRAYGGEGITKEEQEAAWNGLHTVLKHILLLMAPLTPFITDYLWRAMYAPESIHTQEFPAFIHQSEYANKTLELISFDSTVWNQKKAQGLSLKDPLCIEVPQSLKPFEADLRRMHNLRPLSSHPRRNS